MCEIECVLTGYCTKSKPFKLKTNVSTRQIPIIPAHQEYQAYVVAFGVIHHLSETFQAP